MLFNASPNSDMLIHGRAPREGEIMTNPNLGRYVSALYSNGKQRSKGKSQIEHSALWQRKAKKDSILVE